MRAVRLDLADRAALAAGAAVLLVIVVGCSPQHVPDTTIVFDGQIRTIHAPVDCTVQPDGRLVILVQPRSDGGRQMVRVVLSREGRLVVHRAGLRFHEIAGFSDESGELFATKVDDTYNVSGRMPPNAGETEWHQFEIETTCVNEVGYTPRPAV